MQSCIVCFSTSFWGFREGSREHIMRGLSNICKVLYVDYPLNPLHLIRYPHTRAYYFGKRRLEETEKNICVLRTGLHIPCGYNSRLINSFNQSTLKEYARKSLASLNWKTKILWLYHPGSHLQIGGYKEACSVYHCIDNFHCEKRSTAKREFLLEAEEAICKKSRLVLTQNEFLAKKLSAFDPERIEVFPPGLSDTFYADVIHVKRNRLNHEGFEKTIGFVGSIDERIDFKIIKNLATAFSSWRFCLVGPVMGRFNEINKLAAFTNIIFAGLKTQRLAQIYASFDAGFIPYKVNAFTNGIFPIKTYEYFSLGLPVLATPFAAAQEMQAKGLLYVADVSNFVENIRRVVMHKENAAVIKKRMDFAVENLWSRKISLLKGLISQYL